MANNKQNKKGTKDPRILSGEDAQTRYDDLKTRGLIIYECVVGSTAYGTNLPTSDIDKKFIYIETLDHMLDGNYSIQLNLTDDYVGYELGRYLDLLGKQNPNIIELLHADKQFVEFCHPLFEEIIVSNRDNFLSKKVAFSFGSYAKTQIDKAQGTNKKFMNPMDGPRKSLLDFAWVPGNQGSIPLKDWLASSDIKNINPEYIGLSAIDHMRYTYHIFIDPHFDIWSNDNNFKSIYNGPVDVDGVQPKLSSIPKGQRSMGIVQFNMDGFQKYCDDYKEYHEWLEKRNIQRFVENASNEHNFDRKNMMHCHRLLDMCIEILNGDGVNVLRPNREELLGIRLGNRTYQELVDKANEKIKTIEALYESSELPEEADKVFINSILLNFRKHFYGI